MRLSDRLQMMADQIAPGEIVADIGTDHGYLPIYLVEVGRSPHVILTDISKGSLEKAAGNCRAYDPVRTWDLRIGDGLLVLAPGEVDAVVIAGMGGLLIANMLDADPALTASIPRFILQPRNNAGKLRYRLCARGMRVVRELLVCEGNRICEILVVQQAEVSAQEDIIPYEQSPERYDYPHQLVTDAGPLTMEYLTAALAKEKRNLTYIGRARTDQSEATRRARMAIDQIEAIMKEVTTLEQE